MSAEAIHDSCCKRLAAPQQGLEEKALDDEPELFRGFARDIVGYQKEDADDKKGPFRGFHAKIHAGLIAEFQVLGDLPEHARYGVFAAPRTFPAYVPVEGAVSETVPLPLTATPPNDPPPLG